MESRASRVRAVVWVERDAALPATLAAALDRQAIEPEIAAGPFDAFSRVLARRGEKGRVLLMVEPDGLPLASDLRRAIDRYDPAVGCWAYRAHGSPKLAPMPAEPAPRPQVVVPANGPRRPVPALRLSGDTEEAGSDEHAEQPETPRSLLTPEELAMLLADEPGEGRP